MKNEDTYMKHVKLKPVYGAAVALWIAQLTA
jgi:hypothetical protein